MLCTVHLLSMISYRQSWNLKSSICSKGHELPTTALLLQVTSWVTPMYQLLLWKTCFISVIFHFFAEQLFTTILHNWCWLKKTHNPKVLFLWLPVLLLRPQTQAYTLTSQEMLSWKYQGSGNHHLHRRT